MSASEHIHNVLSDSAQTLHALRVLRHHGLNEAGLQTVFRAVVVSIDVRIACVKGICNQR